ncbi:MULTISPECIES: hypothetical protein [unclassified Streptomyces]|uniref:NmrA family NAD(P)-binding protein n=1 Tax=unclassified Streptomyces TaxID=2593676 RepID=UPI0036F78DBB
MLRSPVEALSHTGIEGTFAADAFDALADHLGRTIEIAGDELTGPRIAEVFARAADRPVRFAPQPIEQIRAHSEEMAEMFDWFITIGFRADVLALRAARPPDHAAGLGRRALVDAGATRFRDSVKPPPNLAGRRPTGLGA